MVAVPGDGVDLAQIVLVVLDHGVQGDHRATGDGGRSDRGVAGLLGLRLNDGGLHRVSLGEPLVRHRVAAPEGGGLGWGQPEPLELFVEPGH